MKRGYKVQACGLEQILLLMLTMAIGSLSAGSVWAADETSPDATARAASKAGPEREQAEDDYHIDQIRAEARLLSVPTELLEAEISAWTLAPFDEAQLAAADPFATLNQPLLRPQARQARPQPAQMTAGTQMRIPSLHKIIDDQQAGALYRRLSEDERTTAVFAPKLAFIDGTTGTAVAGTKTPFVVGWKDDLPQTRVISQGKMIRLKTVLDDDTIWLDYEIVISRILDVATRSVRIAGRSQPLKLAAPKVQTARAVASTEMPLGGTLLVGGLPAEDEDHQLLVMIRVDRLRGLQLTPAVRAAVLQAQVRSDVEPAEWQKKEPSQELSTAKPQPKPKRRNPFSLISRILNRAPQVSEKSPVEEGVVDEPNILRKAEP